jgi:hypothetical protein
MLFDSFLMLSNLHPLDQHNKLVLHQHIYNDTYAKNHIEDLVMIIKSARWLISWLDT